MQRFSTIAVISFRGSRGNMFAPRAKDNFCASTAISHLPNLEGHHSKQNLVPLLETIHVYHV